MAILASDGVAFTPSRGVWSRIGDPQPPGGSQGSLVGNRVQNKPPVPSPRHGHAMGLPGNGDMCRFFGSRRMQGLQCQDLRRSRCGSSDLLGRPAGEKSVAFPGRRVDRGGGDHQRVIAKPLDGHAWLPVAFAIPKCLVPNAPEPSLGQLGKVGRDREPEVSPAPSGVSGPCPWARRDDLIPLFDGGLAVEVDHEKSPSTTCHDLEVSRRVSDEEIRRCMMVPPLSVTDERTLLLRRTRKGLIVAEAVEFRPLRGHEDVPVGIIGGGDRLVGRMQVTPPMRSGTMTLVVLMVSVASLVWCGSVVGCC